MQLLCNNAIKAKAEGKIQTDPTNFLPLHGLTKLSYSDNDIGDWLQWKRVSEFLGGKESSYSGEVCIAIAKRARKFQNFKLCERSVRIFLFIYTSDCI